MGIDHGGREDFAHGHGDGVSRRTRKRSHRGGLAPSGGCGLSHLPPRGSTHSPGHRTVWARGAIDHRVQRCCVGGCHLARPGCGKGLRCRSARRSRTRRRQRARRARRTPGCSRRARESDDRSTHLGNPQEHGPAKGASCRRAQGPARNDQESPNCTPPYSCATCWGPRCCPSHSLTDRSPSALDVLAAHRRGLGGPC